MSVAADEYVGIKRTLARNKIVDLVGDLVRLGYKEKDRLTYQKMVGFLKAACFHVNRHPSPANLKIIEQCIDQLECYVLMCVFCADAWEKYSKVEEVVGLRGSLELLRKEIDELPILKSDQYTNEHQGKEALDTADKIILPYLLLIHAFPQKAENMAAEKTRNAPPKTFYGNST